MLATENDSSSSHRILWVFIRERRVTLRTHWYPYVNDSELHHTPIGGVEPTTLRSRPRAGEAVGHGNPCCRLMSDAPASVATRRDLSSRGRVVRGMLSAACALLN